jgi:hypothetical protein
MEQPPSIVTEIVQRFAEMNLPDARLVSLRAERRADDLHERLVLEVQLVAGVNADELKDATLTFLGCAEVRIAMDLWAKRLMDDTICFAECTYDRDWIRLHQSDAAPRQATQRLEYMVRFEIDLTPPGGEIVVYARDFELTSE